MAGKSKEEEEQEGTESGRTKRWARGKGTRQGMARVCEGQAKEGRTCQGQGRWKDTLRVWSSETWRPLESKRTSWDF